MEKMREEFEVWANTSSLKSFLFWHPSYNQYEVHAVQMAFEGWKASRAALCVKIPKHGESSSFGDYVVFDADEARVILDKAGFSYE